MESISRGFFHSEESYVFTELRNFSNSIWVFFENC